MTLSGIRRDVFMDRYARKDGEGKAIETSPEQMWERVAAAVAEVEAPEARPQWAARFRRALDGFKFVPGGRILAGAGTGQKVTFYNCLPPDQPVLTPEGYVPIAEVDARDFVVTGQGRARMVTQVFAREADEPLYEARLAGGAGLLRLTGNHPVLARQHAGAEAAWVRAADLTDGDLVACLDGGGRRRPGDGRAWHVRRDEPVGWSPRAGAQVLVRERRETYVGVAWRAVAAVERVAYCGTVYDLEVEEDHSFVTAGAIVSNCYVIPSPEDSRRGIMDSVGLMVEIMSRGGGVGVNLSSLRPRGSYVRGVNGTASGPVSWGEVYSTATGAVIQGGSRRGALMLMLDDDHPDVEEFITVKKDLNRINNANLSVCVSDRFMEAVKSDADWELQWDGKVYKTIRARDLWNLICESAWASGEPGVVFMERCQKWSNTWYCENIRCVNPCGEQPLGPWGVCNLGAINIAAFVNDKKFEWESLRETVAVATRFLDNVIDATEYYFDENEQQQRHGIRRTGLGSMGLADALIKLELRYGSPEAIEFCDRLYETVRDVAYRTSAEIAAVKGPFPSYDREQYQQGHFIKRLPSDVRELIAKNGIRNGVLLTQAPTGTTSLLAGVSSGIEPVYAFSFKRVDRTGTHVVYHELYRQWMEQHPDEAAPPYFVSADQLTPEEHVRMQAAIQSYVDASISKTVNAPNAHTIEEVKTLYTLAYELGCKGVTYFRDGCRAGVLTKIEDEKPKGRAQAAEDDEVFPLGHRVNGRWGHIRPIERPARLIGFTDRKKTPLGTLFLTLNTLDGHPVELFATIGKAGSDVSAFTEGIARLVSVALRSGVDPSEVANQLKGIGGSRSVGFGPGRVRSVPDAMGQFIDEILQQSEGSERPTEGKPHHNGRGRRGAHAVKPAPEAVASEVAASPSGQAQVPAEAGGEVHASTFNLCPACGLHTLAYTEGCALCFSCGYSEC